MGQYGFVGVGWVILVSALLQTFYNVECSRYVLATGETPVVGWGRVPPGWMLWVPLSVLIVIFAFIAGGWAASAGQGVYALVHGVPRPPTPPSRGSGPSACWCWCSSSPPPPGASAARWSWPTG
ncbi:hypothetical protein ACFQ0B_32900 [Nonomuraea thailandensis]